MSIYLVGVLLAFILYRYMRWYDLKHPERADGETTYENIFICYVVMLFSYIGALIFLVFIIKELSKNSKPPKWL